MENKFLTSRPTLATVTYACVKLCAWEIKWKEKISTYTTQNIRSRFIENLCHNFLPPQHRHTPTARIPRMVV